MLRNDVLTLGKKELNNLEIPHTHMSGSRIDEKKSIPAVSSKPSARSGMMSKIKHQHTAAEGVEVAHIARYPMCQEEKFSRYTFVTSLKQLQIAIHKAQPGELIELDKGIYHLDEGIASAPTTDETQSELVPFNNEFNINLSFIWNKSFLKQNREIEEKIDDSVDIPSRILGLDKPSMDASQAIDSSPDQTTPSSGSILLGLVHRLLKYPTMTQSTMEPSDDVPIHGQDVEDSKKTLDSLDSQAGQDSEARPDSATRLNNHSIPTLRIPSIEGVPFNQTISTSEPTFSPSAEESSEVDCSPLELGNKQSSPPQEDLTTIYESIDLKQSHILPEITSSPPVPEKSSDDEQNSDEGGEYSNYVVPDPDQMDPNPPNEINGAIQGPWNPPTVLIQDVHGTVDLPITICGPRSAVLDGFDGQHFASAALRLIRSSYVRVKGFTLQNALKGKSKLVVFTCCLSSLART